MTRRPPSATVHDPGVHLQYTLGAGTQPQIEALRADLGRLLSGARDERQQLLTVCASHGLAPALLRGHHEHIEHTHVAIAATVGSGVADVGPGVEAAVLECGLHFVPLIEEDSLLACVKHNLASPAVQRLRGVLAGSAWSQRLWRLPGYAPASTPRKVLVMTAALPWWRFARAKAASPSTLLPTLTSLTP